MKRRVLFFIAEGVPTDEERAAAERLGLDKRCFRNAQAVSNGFIEKCDAVAGCVPEPYASKYPRADAPAPASEPVPAESDPKPRGRRKQQ